MEEARQATGADLDALAEIWDRGVSELDGQRGGFLLAGNLVHDDLAGYLSASLADPDRLLVLGLIDDFPVGLASVICARDRREPVGNLELIFVEAGAREIGVAEAMLDLVAEWCTARGCVGIDAPALPGNRAAKSFFESRGFLARLLIMHYPLGDVALGDKPVGHAPVGDVALGDKPVGDAPVGDAS